MTLGSRGVDWDMGDTITGDHIESYLTGKISMLKYAERCAREVDQIARIADRERDLAEWEVLDDDSKRYLVNYLRNPQLI